MSSSVKRYLAGAVAVAAVSVLAACGGSGGGAGGGTSGVASDSAVGSRGVADGGFAGSAPAPAEKAPSGGNRTPVQTRAVISTGTVTLTSGTPDRARAEIGRLLTGFGGFLANEHSVHAEDGTLEHATLVLRVPAAKFRAAMGALERIGTLKSSDSSSDDVTTQVIDVEERVRTLQNSLARLHKFQKDAANIDDLIRFEQQITDRESQLQSLTAQRDYLAGQASMATITVELSTPVAYTPPRGTGFLAGLRAGWHALISTVLVALTVVGALLPFGVLAALLGVPAWVLVRRARRHRRTAAGAAAASDG